MDEIQVLTWQKVEMEGDAPGPFVSIKTKSLLTSSSRQLTIPQRIPGAGDTYKGGR